MRLAIEFLLFTVFSVPVYVAGLWRGKHLQMALYQKVPCMVCEMRSKLAWYTMRGHQIFAKVPWLGKFVVSAMVGFWYTRILKEGRDYGRRRTTTHPS